MKRLMIMLCVVAAVGATVLLSTGPAAADATYTVDVNPNSISPGGTGPSLWDTGGGVAVGNPGGFPDGFGGGSFMANGSSYVKYGFSEQQLDNLLGYDPTIGELKSISYYTKTSTKLPGPPDGNWFLQIYTVKQASGNYGSWYHDILNAEPYLANNISAPANTWNQWQTNNSVQNQLTFGIDTNQNGAYGDPILSSISSNPAYESQYIDYLSLDTATGWASGFTGQVAGLSFTLTDPKGGTDTVNVDFSPVPEPAGIVALLGLAGMGLIGLVWRRRRAAA